MQRGLSYFEALSFDCYGTLIDWEAGIAAVLRTWAARRGSKMDSESLLVSYASHEATVATKTRRPPIPTFSREPCVAWAMNSGPMRDSLGGAGSSSSSLALGVARLIRPAALDCDSACEGRLEIDSEHDRSAFVQQYAVIKMAAHCAG
jgi:hypothetical protein